MNAKNYLYVFAVGITTMLLIACTESGMSSVKSSVNDSITVAIYSMTETDSVPTPLYPSLIEEKVHISEMYNYAGDDGCVTVPFYFSDKKKYEEITRMSIGKRIAIAINGKIVSTPEVQMAIENGACSVVLDDSQLSALFPDSK